MGSTLPFLLLAACGSEPNATSPSTIDIDVTSSVPSPDVGGFGVPAAAAGEFDPLPGIEMTGTAKRSANGCWYLSGNGESGLLIAPTGTRFADDGATLVLADGTQIADRTSIDTAGGLVALGDLPGGADGRWGNYAAFCDPTYDFVVVAESLAVAFDPAVAELDGAAAELDATVFDTDYGCGYGFTTGDALGRWALRIDVTTGTPPAPGPVNLPDDRFDVKVTFGAHLFANHCDDVMEWFEPLPSRAAEWKVTAGSFTYPETPDTMCSGSPPATITLVDASVQTPSGPVELDPIEITNTAPGCFAG